MTSAIVTKYFTNADKNKNRKGGFGFAVDKTTGNEYFLHISKIVLEDKECRNIRLYPGEEIVFDVSESSRNSNEKKNLSEALNIRPKGDKFICEKIYGLIHEAYLRVKPEPIVENAEVKEEKTSE